MRRATLALLISCAGASAAPPAVAPAPRPLEFAIVESSLATGGGHIRQHAFDGDPGTHFASARNAAKGDHLTLTFDKPVALRSVSVLAARPDGEDALSVGVMEVSADGKAFAEVARFEKGKATAAGEGKPAKAVRIRATEDLKHPLVVREIMLDSDPKVALFRFPVEFTLDTADAPESREWGEKAVRACERHYPRICDLLASDGFVPRTQIRMTLKPDYKGVAAAGGGRITGSSKYFRDHPDDVGAMVHETAHCVQDYKGRNLPVGSWRGSPTMCDSGSTSRARPAG